ncbi:MAG: SemiSWEET transporter [Bacteroidota bacterium]
MENIEIVGMLAAFLTTSAFVPQVYKAYRNKSAKDVSLTMYLVLLVGLLLWLYYGWHIESMAIIMANSVTAILVIFILVLKIVYERTP